jgi:hypothetical protein
MATGVLAALLAVLVLGFVEGLRRFYPAHEAWWRIRRTHGRRAARAMRERYEAAAGRSTPRRLATLLLCLVITWIAVASLLDKRWNEVLLDVTPYVFIWVALLRTPGALSAIAERMRRYERSAGEDPDAGLDEGDGGPTSIAL